MTIQIKGLCLSGKGWLQPVREDSKMHFSTEPQAVASGSFNWQPYFFSTHPVATAPGSVTLTSGSRTLATLYISLTRRGAENTNNQWLNLKLSPVEDAWALDASLAWIFDVTFTLSKSYVSASPA